MSDTDNLYILDVKGNVIKRDRDLSKDAEKIINVANTMILENKFEEALSYLLNFEKEVRNAADLASYTKIVVLMLDAHVRYEQWDRLMNMITFLSKRRGQFKQAIVEIVQRCTTYLDHIHDKDIRIKFINNLCQVSENRIYVENERARLLMILSKIAEDDGNIDEALNLIRELQVESYADMGNDERNGIMLEQIRLCLAKNDIIRAQIISKRINPKTIDEEANPTLKFKYYHILIKLKFLERKYIEVTQLALASTALPSVSSDPQLLYPVLKTAVICLMACPFDQTRQDLSHRVRAHRNFIELDYLKSIMEMFMIDELMNWFEIDSKHGNSIKNFLLPNNCPYVTGSNESETIYTLLRTRVNQHNLIVVYHCYSQIYMSRLAQLLDLSEEDAETALCQAVYSKVIFARIDRPKRIINFEPYLNPPQVLNAYLGRVDSLLLKIGHVATLINKEVNNCKAQSIEAEKSKLSS